MKGYDTVLKKFALMKRQQGQKVWPLFGAAIVFKQQRRGRRFWRDLVGVICLVLAIVALAVAFQLLMFNEDGTAGFAKRRLTLGSIAATIILMGSAAVLGAKAAPGIEEAEGISASLMTQLSAFDICTGRLLAVMWNPFTVMAVSCIFWMMAQIQFEVVSSGDGGLLSIALAHLIILCAMIMVAATGLLFGLRSKPGRAWGRGISAGLLLTALCAGALFLVDPTVKSMENPSKLIWGTLVINPVFAVETALKRDILRAGWVYVHSSAADYQLVYPSPFTSAGVYIVFGVIAHSLAVIRLRRAYR